MGLLNNLLNIKRRSGHSESSTPSGIGKEEFLDWAAVTQGQKGCYSALTIAKNLKGAGLTFRCKTNSPQKIFTLSLSGKSESYLFEINRKYKIRLKFDNTVVLYAYLHAYRTKHATIIGISDKIIENMSDSQSLKIDFISQTGKNITTKFSLKGASVAINSAIARSNEEKVQICSWLMSTAHHAEVPST